MAPLVVRANKIELIIIIFVRMYIPSKTVITPDDSS